RVLFRSSGEERAAAYREARRRWTAGEGIGARREARSVKVVAYTDSRESSGAELSLATVLGGLRSDIDVTVLGTDAGVVERLASARPGAERALVPPVSTKRDLRPILAHLRAVRRLRPDVFHANLRIPWSCQYGIAAALLARRTRVIAVEQLFTPPASSSQRTLKRLASLGLDAHVAVGARLAR